MGINYPFRSTDCNCANCGNCYNNLDKSCNNTPCLFLSGLREITHKRIQNQVRVASSNYITNLSAFTIRGGFKNSPSLSDFNVNQSQMSDRNKLHIQTRYVPRRANSTRSSITANRPGSMGPAGKNALGVDIKHNSYDRYLGRLKAKNLQASWDSDNDPFTNSHDHIKENQKYSNINYSILGGGLCRTCKK